MQKVVSVLLTGNAGPLRDQLLVAARDVEVFGRSVGRMGDTVTASTGRAIAGGQLMGAALLGAGALAAAGFGAAVVGAGRFEAEMRNVATISADTRAHFGRTSDALVDMSRQFPQTATELAQGLYDIASSGFDGTEAMEVLESSARAASAGLTTTETAARGITAALNAYGTSGYAAADVSDVLFQTVNLGVLTFEELASSLGDFIGSAAALGVPLDDASAALATMTLSGISAAEASTSLNRVLQSLIDPSEAMTAQLQSLGYESGVAAVGALGLQGVMDLLRTSTSGNIETLVQLFPELRAARGALALMAADGENYRRVAAGITDENARVGATMRALEEQSQGAAFQWQLFVNTISAFGLEAAGMVLPFLTDLLSVLTGVAGFVGDLPEPLKVAAVGFGLLATAATLAGGAFLLLAPRIVATRAALATMDLTTLHLGMKAASAAAGPLTIALVAGTAALWAYTKEKAEAKARTAEFVTALKAEQDGLTDEVSAVVASQLAKEGLVDQAQDLGASLDLVIRAARGETEAMRELVDQYGVFDHGLFGAKVLAIGGAHNKAAAEVRQETEANEALNPSMARTAEQLAELEQRYGLVESATGEVTDSTTEMAHAVGLSRAALMELALGSEAAAKALRDEVVDAMDQVRSAMERDFDLVAAFSASSWESMQRDAEKGAGAVESSTARMEAATQGLADAQERMAENSASAYERLQSDAERAAGGVAAAEERLADQVQDLIWLRERQAEKDKLTVADRQAVERAERDVARASRDLEEAQREAQEAQEALNAGVRVGVSDQRALERAERDAAAAADELAESQAAATGGIGTMGEEIARFYEQSLQQGAEFTANIRTAIEQGYDPGLVARLLQEGPEQAAPLLETLVSDHSGRLRDLVNESEKALAEVTTGAVEMARLTQLAVSSHSDQMGKDLKAAMRIVQLEAANGGRLTTSALAKEMGIGLDDVERIVRSFGIDVISEMDTTAGAIVAGWARSLMRLPVDTRARAWETSDAFTGPISGLAPWAQLAGENTKEAWLEKMTVAARETGIRAAEWAAALVDHLNPILSGVGAQTIALAAGSSALAAARNALPFAAGGFAGGVPGPGSGDVFPAMLEPGEYVWTKAAVEAIGASNLDLLHRRYLHGYATGGLVDGLPVPPVLAELFGAMLGGTTDAATGYTYAAALAGAPADVAGRPTGEAPPGSVTDWVRAAAMFTGVGESWVPALYRRAMYESSGDPHAINLWDWNAQQGHPSKGLMQTIDSTFDAYAAPGHRDIWNPVHNTIAAIGYILDTYGTIFAIDPPVSGYRAGGHVRSFDAGGWLEPGWTLAYNGLDHAERVDPGRPMPVQSAARALLDLDYDRMAKGIARELAPLLARQRPINITARDGADALHVAAELNWRLG